RLPPTARPRPAGTRGAGPGPAPRRERPPRTGRRWGAARSPGTPAPGAPGRQHGLRADVPPGAPDGPQHPVPRRNGQRALPVPAVRGRHVDALRVRPLRQVHTTSLLYRTCVCYLEHTEQANYQTPTGVPPEAALRPFPY